MQGSFCSFLIGSVSIVYIAQRTRPCSNSPFIARVVSPQDTHQAMHAELLQLNPQLDCIAAHRAHVDASSLIPRPLEHVIILQRQSSAILSQRGKHITTFCWDLCVSSGADGIPSSVHMGKYHARSDQSHTLRDRSS